MKRKHTFRSSPPHAGRIDATDLSTTPTASARTLCLQLTHLLRLPAMQWSMTNRAAKKLAFITSWENAKKAEMEAELKKIEVS